MKPYYWPYVLNDFLLDRLPYSINLISTHICTFTFSMPTCSYIKSHQSDVHVQFLWFNVLPLPSADPGKSDIHWLNSVWWISVDSLLNVMQQILLNISVWTIFQLCMWENGAWGKKSYQVNMNYYAEEYTLKIDGFHLNVAYIWIKFDSGYLAQVNFSLDAYGAIESKNLICQYFP